MPATAKTTGKRQWVYISKTRTLHVHHAFLYVSHPSLHDCDVKLPNFTHPLYNIAEHNARNFRQHLAN